MCENLEDNTMGNQQETYGLKIKGLIITTKVLILLFSKDP